MKKYESLSASANSSRKRKCMEAFNCPFLKEVSEYEILAKLGQGAYG
jgi:hypothetical protein